MSPILEVEYIGLLGNYNNSQSGILYIMDECLEDRTQGRQRKETKEAPVDGEKMRCGEMDGYHRMFPHIKLLST